MCKNVDLRIYLVFVSFFIFFTFFPPLAFFKIIVCVKNYLFRCIVQLVAKFLTLSTCGISLCTHWYHVPHHIETVISFLRW